MLIHALFTQPMIEDLRPFAWLVKLASGLSGTRRDGLWLNLLARALHIKHQIVGCRVNSQSALGFGSATWLEKEESLFQLTSREAYEAGSFGGSCPWFL